MVMKRISIYFAIAALALVSCKKPAPVKPDPDPITPPDTMIVNPPDTIPNPPVPPKPKIAAFRIAISGLEEGETISEAKVGGNVVAMEDPALIRIASESTLSFEDFAVELKAGSKTYLRYFDDRITIQPDDSVEINFNVLGFEKKDVYRIFLIGNSFTQDACHRLPGVLVGLGIKNVEVTQCYYGGRTVPEYNTGWSTSSDYTKHTALPGQDVMTNTSNQNLEAVAKSQQWDLVCIQEHTGNYRAWTWNAEEKNHIKELMEKVAATQKVRPRFYWIMSQSYYDMNKIGTGSRPYITWNTQSEMYDVTTAFAQKVMAELPFDGICATGTALQNLRQTSLNNVMNLTRDGYHMDYGLSRYTAACTLYQVMLYPRMGIKLETCKFRIPELIATSGSYTTPVTDANAPIAFKAAKAAAKVPFQVSFINESVGEEGAAGGSLGSANHGTL